MLKRNKIQHLIRKNSAELKKLLDFISKLNIGDNLESNIFDSIENVAKIDNQILDIVEGMSE